MKNGSVELIVSKLDQVADKIGVSLEALYPCLVRHQWTEAIVSVFFLVVFMVASFFSVKFYVKHKNRMSDDETLAVVAGFISVVGLIVSLVLSVINVVDLFNIEYAVLSDVAYMLKSSG
jgi:uncharacterized protein YacL